MSGFSSMIKIVWFLLFVLLGYIAAVLLVFARLLWASIKLDRYLKNHDYARWRDLNSFRNGQLVGFVNHEKYKGFVNSDTDGSDEHLLKLKDSVRIYLRYFKLVVIGMIAHILVSAVCIVLMKSKGLI